jgi:hypothetical protein
MTTRKRSRRGQLQIVEGQRSSAPVSTPSTSGSGSYGSRVRAQVFEFIVRQAQAGDPWREIFAGPMKVNNITPQEILDELNKRPPPSPPAAAAGIPRPPVFKDYTQKQ